MEHKIILNGGEIYLPFARKRVNVLRAAGLKFASQSFKVGDASIDIRVDPGNEYFRLDGGAARYQFFVSEPTLTTEVFGGSPRYKGYAVAAFTKTVPKAQGLVVEGKPRGSSVVASAAGASPSWPLVTADKLGKKFPFRDVFQNQAISEYEFYPQGASGALSKTPLVSSWASGSQVENVAAYGGSRQAEMTSLSIDADYDVPTTRNGKWRAPDADWYKRAAIRVVQPPKDKPELGARTFYLLVDISNVLHVYPAGIATDEPLGEYEASLKDFYADQAIKTNIPEKYVQRVDLPLPDWARKNLVKSRDVPKTPGLWVENLLLNAPQYRWAFNSLGTKMCSVVYELLPVTNVPSVGVLTFKNRYTADTHPLQEALPGFAEISIDITITGEKREEFTVMATQARELRPTASGKYVLGADYAWPIPDLAVLDDILLMTMSVYHESADRSGVGAARDIDVNKTVIDVENLSAPTVEPLRSFLTSWTNKQYHRTTSPDRVPDGAAKVWQAKAVIVAYDLRSMAFVIRQKYTEFQTRFFTVGPNQVGVLDDQSGMSAARVKTYMRNELVEETVMSTDAGLDAALVASFAQDTAGAMFKMPITERGVIGNNVYQALAVPGPYTPQGDSLAQVPLDVGAALYAGRASELMCATGSSQFAVHPNGSWSVSTPPIAYYEGSRAGGVSTGGNFPTYPFDIMKMRSTRMDIVHFRDKLDVVGKPPEDKRDTTHRAIFNEAYGKNLTEADFLPTYEMRVIADGNPATNGSYVVDSKSQLAFRVTGGSPYPWVIDTLVPNTMLAFGMFSGTGDPAPKVSVLGGSALFF